MIIGWECGTCGSRVLILSLTAGQWTLRCGEDHPWVPACDLTLTIDTSDFPVPQEESESSA